MYTWNFCCCKNLKQLLLVAACRILMVECVPVPPCCSLVLPSLPHAHQWVRSRCYFLVVPGLDAGWIHPKICDLTFWTDARSCSDNDRCGLIPVHLDTVSSYGAQSRKLLCHVSIGWLTVGQVQTRQVCQVVPLNRVVRGM